MLPNMGIKQRFRGEENPWDMPIEEAATATTGDMSGADPRSPSTKKRCESLNGNGTDEINAGLDSPL